MDMGPNEKYFKHVKQTSGEREKEEENKTWCGKENREQTKEMVIPQCKYPI